jgi:hypothetical protein
VKKSDMWVDTQIRLAKCCDAGRLKTETHLPVALASKGARKVEGDQLTRGDVFGLVRKGEWTPARAEDWAKRLGLPPFTGKPDIAAYDPTKEPNWTLCMALIWVASRDIGEVREAWPEWWEAHKTWREFELHGKRCWSLGPPRRPEDYSRYDAYPIDPRTAVKQLWRELQTGAIVATGVSKREGLRRVIRREEWCDLRPCGSHPVIAYFLDSACAGRNEWSSEAFTKVLLPAEQVLRGFPRGGGAAVETSHTDDEVRALIRRAKDENGGFISQENGARIVRKEWPSVNKKRAMELVREITGNTKQGPKGPRRKLCG